MSPDSPTCWSGAFWAKRAHSRRGGWKTFIARIVEQLTPLFRELLVSSWEEGPYEVLGVPRDAPVRKNEEGSLELCAPGFAHGEVRADPRSLSFVALAVGGGDTTPIWCDRRATENST